MRILLVLVVLALALTAASPILGGVLIARGFAAVARDVPRFQIAPGAVLELDADAYRAGLFQSELSTPLGSAVPGAARLHHRVFHGPLPYGRLHRGPAAVVVETTLERACGEPAPDLPFRVVTTVYLDRSIETELDADAIDTPCFTLVGATASLSVNADRTRAQGRLEWTELELDSDALDLSMGDARVDLDTQPSKRGAPLGMLRASLDRARVRTPSGQELRARDLSLSQRTELDEVEGTLSAEGALHLGVLQVGTSEYREADVSLALRNLDEQAVAAIRERVREEPVPASSRARALRVQQAVTDQLSVLLRHAPEIQLSTGQVVTPNGPLELSFELRGRPEMADLPMTNALSMLATIDFQLDVDMSQAHFRRVALAMARTRAESAGQPADDPALLEGLASEIETTLLARGFVQTEGGGSLSRYRSQIQYKTGGLRVNGDPVNLLQLMSPAGPPLAR